MNVDVPCALACMLWCSVQDSGCNDGLMDYAFSHYQNPAADSKLADPIQDAPFSHDNEILPPNICKSSYTTAIPQGGFTDHPPAPRCPRGWLRHCPALLPREELCFTA